MMQHLVHSNTMKSFILILLCLCVTSASMQTFTIEVANLQEIVTSSLDRLLGEIDPSIGKLKNITIEVLSFLERRIQTNVADVLYWLETNLFLVLFGAIVFIILVAVLLTLLDTLFIRYGFSAEQRRFFGLTVITAIFVYLLVAVTLSAWPPAERLNLQTFKYVLFGLLVAAVVYLIFVWISCIYRHRVCEYLPIFLGSAARNRILVGEPTIKITQRQDIEL